MMMRVCRWLLSGLLLLSLAGIVRAQESHPGTPQHSDSAKPSEPPQHASPSSHAPQPGGPGVLRLLPADSVTQHTIDLPGGALAYAATAGTLPLFDPGGEPKANVFYTAYVAKGSAGAERPVTFVFNGGPGAASAFLHLGLVGPKIIDFGPDQRHGAAAKMRDNPQTWLAFTDLVLIDPIGTGWSRTAKPDDEEAFYGVHADADTIAKVIALYVARNGRAASPKYLLGESYGGFRAVKVARALQDQQGIIVCGLLMVSPLLEGAFLFGSDRFALGAALELPSLIASELERTHSFSAEALAAGERFAMTDYLITLAGPAPTGEKAEAFYGRVAQLTGLPIETVRRTRGFVRGEYVKNLRVEERQVVSHYDVTFAAPDPAPESAAAEGPDPILDGYVRALGGAFVGYAADQLGYRSDMTYRLLAGDVSHKWKWHEGHSMQPPSVTDDLRELLSLDPSMRCLIAQGYSDLVIPYFTTQYIRDHLPTNGIAERVGLKLYRGGHMFYLDDEPRRAFTADAMTFYGAAAAPSSH
jgi:carboxypeptidase C (cathepsin A)